MTQSTVKIGALRLAVGVLPQAEETVPSKLWSFPVQGRIAKSAGLVGSADRGPMLVGRVAVRGLIGRAGKNPTLVGRFAPNSPITVKTLFSKT